MDEPTGPDLKVDESFVTPRSKQRDFGDKSTQKPRKVPECQSCGLPMKGHPKGCSTECSAARRAAKDSHAESHGRADNSDRDLENEPIAMPSILGRSRVTGFSRTHVVCTFMDANGIPEIVRQASKDGYQVIAVLQDPNNINIGRCVVCATDGAALKAAMDNINTAFGWKVGSAISAPTSTSGQYSKAHLILVAICSFLIGNLFIIGVLICPSGLINQFL